MTASRPQASIAREASDVAQPRPAVRAPIDGEGIRARLKHGTAELHLRVEAQMRLADRLASDATYRRLLECLFGFVAPLEARLSTVSWPDDLAFPTRRKTRHLAGDLVQLGHTRETIAALPRCSALPPLTTRAAAFGCLYVLEGSTLGGRVILRAIRASLGRDAQSGAAYFAGYGERTGALWSSFQLSLSEAVREPNAMDEAVQAACATFGALERWLGNEPALTPREP